MLSGRLSKTDPTISMLQQKSRHSRLRKRFPVVYHPILVTLFEFHLNYCCLPFSWKQSGHSPLTSKRHFHPANCCSLDIFLSKSWRWLRKIASRLALNKPRLLYSHLNHLSPNCDAQFELREVGHVYVPKWTENQPCDWLIRWAVEQVYLIQWPLKHTFLHKWWIPSFQLFLEKHCNKWSDVSAEKCWSLIILSQC